MINKLSKLKLSEEVKPYLYLGITICIVIAFYKILGNIDVFVAFFMRVIHFILDGLKPLFWAFIISYFLYRPIDYLDNQIIKMNIFKRHVKVSRIISIVIIYIVTMMLIYLVLSFVLPQIWESLIVLLYNAPRYVEQIQQYLSKYHIDNEINQLLINFQGYKKSGASNGMQDIVLELINKKDITFDRALTFLLQRVMSLSTLVLNIVISVFLALYFLLDKEVIGRQISITVKFIISKENYNRCKKNLRLVDELFFKFFIGKIYCSIFVSVIVFLGLVILKVQHSALISLIIAVTNIIPYFGPIIGGAIGVSITLLYSPVKALWVLVLVIISQQLDDNVLVPRILGNRIGLKPFWIMVSVIIGRELFGLKGMFFAVPTFAVMRVICIQWMQTWKGRHQK